METARCVCVCCGLWSVETAGCVCFCCGLQTVETARCVCTLLRTVETMDSAAADALRLLQWEEWVTDALRLRLRRWEEQAFDALRLRLRLKRKKFAC
ncbi:hypothetical protein ACLOJK_026994 [Asimina triloba]